MTECCGGVEGAEESGAECMSAVGGVDPEEPAYIAHGSSLISWQPSTAKCLLRWARATQNKLNVK